MTLYEVLTAADAMPLLMIGPRLMITCSGSSVRSSFSLEAAAPETACRGAVASSLKRQPHGTVSEQATVDPQAGHGQRHGARCR